MKPGARVQGEIVIADLKDALTIPRFVIEKGDSGPTVQRLGPNGPESVAIELGPSSAGRVVVTAGLSAGDRILVSARPGRSDPAQATPSSVPIAAVPGE